MKMMTAICTLGGTAESKVVFEPLTLTAKDLASIFSDKRSKKFLNNLKSLDFDKLKGKLILTDEGIVAVCRQLNGVKATVIVKLFGKKDDFLMAYEVDESKYEIYLEDRNIELRNTFCIGSACWAVPVYVLFPSIYPELCDREACKRFTNM